MKKEAFLKGTPPLLYSYEKSSDYNVVVCTVFCLQQ